MQTPGPRDERPASRAAAEIVVYPDGPLVVRGDFVVTDVDGTPLPHARTVALCRCGRSALKPFCDGSHKIETRRVQPD